MKLTRAIFLAVAFMIPTVATVAQAQDKPATAEPAPDKAGDSKEPKKAKKSKKAKKEEGAEPAKKEEPAPEKK
jgi:hypothetical protein